MGMPTMYEVWTLRADGVLEQAIDPKEGIAPRYDKRDKALEFAKEVAASDEVQEAYVCEVSAVKVVPGGALKGLKSGQCVRCRELMGAPLVQLEFECPELAQKAPVNMTPEEAKNWKLEVAKLGRLPTAKTIYIGDADHPYYVCPHCNPDLVGVIQGLAPEYDAAVGIYKWTHCTVVYGDGKRSVAVPRAAIAAWTGPKEPEALTQARREAKAAGEPQPQ